MKTQSVYRREVSDALQKRKAVLYLLLIFAIAVTLISMAFLIRSISENRAYDRYIEAAQTDTLSGEYERALANLRKAAAIDRSDECLLMMAQCYEALGNYDRAIEALRMMKTSDAAISSKLASIEAKKKGNEQNGTVTIAGVQYAATETSLVLDNQTLGNGVLSEISALYSLNNLSLAGNGLTDITPLSSLGGLTTLNLSGNSIHDISPLRNLTGLRTLYLDSNPISDFSPLYSLSGLTTLSLKGITLSPEALSDLSNALPNCAINGATTDTAGRSGLIALGGESFQTDITSLNLSHRGLTDISALSACQNLTTLNLSGNAISDLTPLMDIPGLQTLNLSSNNITDLRPLMGLTAVKVLDVSANSISSTVPLGSIVSLQELNLANNAISNFTGIGRLKNLNTLNLSGTGFSDADIDQFVNLSRLTNCNVEYNPGLTGEGYRRLQSLIPACYITHSDLVYSVDADRLTITSDTTVLDMTGRGINDLSFLMQLNNLETVYLGSNNISQIFYFQFTESWRTITTLDLSNNYLTDISSLMALKYLTNLDLSNNQIIDVNPLYALTNLRQLNLSGNPIAADQIRALNDALPYCMITF